ncbi:MAG TPA: DnaA/Hda family protein [Longimicrobiales bacterium]|nr:DnaA/Hda family protein [Longimicrobiales bacterium]
MTPDSMSLGLDPRNTFDSYIVGTANRLAAAAAKRVAEAPGAAYNPLFLYAESGLGKTHLIMAIGNHIHRVHENIEVVYDTLEHLMEGVMEAIQAGDRDAFRARLRGASVLLLDDVQFLAGRRGAQEELLRSWDALTARGGQVVLASDRPPAEIDGLDQRLLSRFSGGLMADLSVPDYETRVAIARHKAEERGHLLSAGVAEALAKHAFGNVRELQGALNRIIAVQELDRRPVSAEEVADLLGRPAELSGRDEFGSFMEEVTGTLGQAIPPATPEQRIADAVLRWEAEGYRTRKLEAVLDEELTDEAADELLANFEETVTRLRDIAAKIRELDPAASELSRLDVLRNPDRIEEAESILEQVRERMRPLPPAPDEPRFEQLTLDRELLAVRAARAVAQQPGDRYNPFFVHAPAGAGKTSLVTALALLFRERDRDAEIGFLTGEDFAAELIGALKRNQVDSWRARYRRARLLIIDGIDPLGQTERAQEELFHFFDNARRAGVQLVFTADRPPHELSGFEDRLRTRLESGLVVDLKPSAPDERLGAELDEVAENEGAGEPDLQVDDWFLNREKLLWHWPYLQDSLVQDLE